MVDVAPDSIMLEFLNEDIEPIQLIELGEEFLSYLGINSSEAGKPLKIAIEKKISQAGNAYYEYSQNNMPLPSGLNTYLRLENTIIPMGKTRPSKSSKNPTREGKTEIVVGNKIYKATSYITETKKPYFVKVVAHKKPDTSSNVEKARRAPKGGKII